MDSEGNQVRGLMIMKISKEIHRLSLLGRHLEAYHLLKKISSGEDLTEVVSRLDVCDLCVEHDVTEVLSRIFEINAEIKTAEDVKQFMFLCGLDRERSLLYIEMVSEKVLVEVGCNG